MLETKEKIREKGQKLCGGEMKEEKGKGRKMGMMLHTVIPIPAAQKTAVRKCPSLRPVWHPVQVIAQKVKIK